MAYPYAAGIWYSDLNCFSTPAGPDCLIVWRISSSFRIWPSTCYVGCQPFKDSLLFLWSKEQIIISTCYSWSLPRDSCPMKSELPYSTNLYEKMSYLFSVLLFNRSIAAFTAICIRSIDSARAAISPFPLIWMGMSNSPLLILSATSER